MMDFALDATQTSLRDLAREIFTEQASHDRLKELEAGRQSFDAELWSVLQRAGLSGVGTEDGGFLEQCVVLVEQGRAVAPVPLWSHLLASTVVGSADELLTLALDEPGAEDAAATATSARRTNGALTLTGDKVGVPAMDEATAIVVSAATDDGPALFRVDTKDVRGDRRATTAGFPEFLVHLDDAPASLLTGDANELALLAVVALCAIGVGVAERALEMTASYTSERKQFERPLGSFQAVQQRAADAYIDVEAMRATMWQAAWRLSEGMDAAREVAIAKFWAAEGSQRVVATAQHLHGGMGADIDYPLHRYTLWAKWVELAFGGATVQLARIGEVVAS